MGIADAKASNVQHYNVEIHINMTLINIRDTYLQKHSSLSASPSNLVSDINHNISHYGRRHLTPPARSCGNSRVRAVNRE